MLLQGKNAVLVVRKTPQNFYQCVHFKKPVTRFLISFKKCCHICCCYIENDNTYKMVNTIVYKNIFIMPFFSINDKFDQNNFVGQVENNYLCMYLNVVKIGYLGIMQLAQDTNLFIRNFKHAQ